MGTFLDKFPLVRYTVDKKLLNEYDLVRNITYRIGFIGRVIETNVNAYYFHTIQDSDRPEILAEKLYGNPQAYWMILYANNMYDPYYDWPMDTRSFEKYIIKKYGSLDWAKTNWHHYDKVITRENPFAQVVSTTRFQVNEKILSDGVIKLDNYGNINGLSPDFISGEIAFIGPSNATNTFSGKVKVWNNANGYMVLSNTQGSIAPYEYLNGQTSAANNAVITIIFPEAPMDAYNTLVDTTDFSTYQVAGRTVYETISRDRISYYDYEEQLNESKRKIRIIKPEYYQQIMTEFDNITNRKTFYKRP